MSRQKVARYSQCMAKRPSTAAHMRAYWQQRGNWNQQTSPALRWRIIALSRQRPRPTNREIGRRVAVDEGTVRHWLRRFRATGNVFSRQRPGAPRALVPHQRRGLVRTLVQGGRSGREAHRLGVSTRTVQRTARSAGNRYLSTTRTMPLTAAHKTQRLRFARRHLRMRTNWNQVNLPASLRPSSAFSASLVWWVGDVV